MAKAKGESRLNFLEDLSDYKVASEDPDVRGWELVDRDNQVLGTVGHLLADVEQKRVRYLDVDPNPDLLTEDHEAYQTSAKEGAHEYRDREGNVHMIVPIGMARLDTDNKRVIADKVDRNTFMGSPRLTKGEPVSTEQEREVRSYYEDPVAHRGTTRPAAEGQDVAFKSEHHTKGNENIGTRDERIRRDVTEEPGTTTGGPEGTTSAMPESQREKTVSSSDRKHKERTSAENTGKSVMPDHDQREPKSEEQSRKDLEGMSAEETGLGEDPQVREAQHRSEDSLAGAKSKSPEEQPGHRESDESAARRKQSGHGTEDDYRSENFDEDRFYNRKK